MPPGTVRGTAGCIGSNADARPVGPSGSGVGPAAASQPIRAVAPPQHVVSAASAGRQRRGQIEPQICCCVVIEVRFRGNHVAATDQQRYRHVKDHR